MIRCIAIAFPLLILVGCGGTSENTEDTPVTTESTSTTMLDTALTTDPVAKEPRSTTAESNVDTTDVDTTLPPDTTPTTEAFVVEGADSSEAAVSEWYDAIADSDLSRMWAIIDPQLKSGVSRSVWDACIAAQFEGPSIDSIDYDEVEAYTEDGSVFSTGSGTIEAGGEKETYPITFEVVERKGGWFTVGTVNPNNDESCFEIAAG